jgi:hypothetical protein
MNREARKQLQYNQQKLNMPSGSSSAISNDANQLRQFYLLIFVFNVISLLLYNLLL